MDLKRVLDYYSFVLHDDAEPAAGREREMKGIMTSTVGR
jgi:hypothetical protein